MDAIPQTPGRAWYDLNAERRLPRVLEVFTDILPAFWAEFCRKYRIRLFVLIGYENEVENIKIWPACHILARGIARGDHVGKTKIIDSTSGNFGVALLAALQEIRERDSSFPITGVVTVVPRNLEKPKIKKLESLGAELAYAEDSMHAMQVARELAEKNDYWYTEQYWNTDNTDTYPPIAREIARRLPDLGAYAAGVGSGGVASGTVPTLIECFAKRERPFHAIGVLVEDGEKVGGVRTAPATEPGSLPWRKPLGDVRFVGTERSIVFSAALWRQAEDPCLGGESTGFAGEGLMLGLRSLSIRDQLEDLRAPDGYVHAAFVSADTRKPYRVAYEKQGIFLPEAAWETPVL